MTDNQTIRAWKDDAYRRSLDEDDQSVVSPSPVGTIELDDADLGDVSGGAVAIVTQTTICVTSLACVTVVSIAISKNLSCGACDTTLWSGSCAFSSIGCCP
jgi:mersacidin/lichenicidin family type 2 lantibiotic